MPSGKAALSSVLAPRDRAAEHLLVPAGRRTLTREALEARCLPRLARLLERTAIRHGEDHGRHWKPGDFDILLVETTVGSDAVLYVQFWSEPGGARAPAPSPLNTADPETARDDVAQMAGMYLRMSVGKPFRRLAVLHAAPRGVSHPSLHAICHGTTRRSSTGRTEKDSVKRSPCSSFDSGRVGRLLGSP